MMNEHSRDGGMMMGKRVNSIRDYVIERRKCGDSLRKIAFETGFSHAKVRKILMTEGLYTSPMAEKIKSMYEQGMSEEEIADALNIKVKHVNNYLPYTKGVYMGENPTENALRIRACRERKKEGK